eukprot:scaffold101422_cov32-Tisochrysis_lutea.AAC.6
MVGDFRGHDVIVPLAAPLQPTCKDGDALRRAQMPQPYAFISRRGCEQIGRHTPCNLSRLVRRPCILVSRDGSTRVSWGAVHGSAGKKSQLVDGCAMPPKSRDDGGGVGQLENDANHRLALRRGAEHRERGQSGTGRMRQSARLEGFERCEAI